MYRFVRQLGIRETLLGHSMACELGQPFQEIALGGIRNGTETWGHQQMYVASGPDLLAIGSGAAQSW
jgi:ATP-dependent Lon protease